MVPYLHQFPPVLHKMHFFGAFWRKFESFLVPIWHYIIILKKIRNCPSNGAIRDEFSEQEQHQSTRKANAQSALFCASKVQKCTFQLHCLVLSIFSISISSVCTRILLCQYLEVIVNSNWILDIPRYIGSHKISRYLSELLLSEVSKLDKQNFSVFYEARINILFI